MAMKIKMVIDDEPTGVEKLVSRQLSYGENMVPEMIALLRKQERQINKLVKAHAVATNCTEDQVRWIYSIEKA